MDGFGRGGGMQGDTDLLTSASGDADAGAATLDTMLSDLMNKLEPLMTEWVGRGGLSFQEVREACEGELRKLNGALHRLGTKVGDTSIAYVNADDEISTVVTSSGTGATGITAALQP